ncbi:Bug family tripartite tricarboxylate transporter substrate binding protein [Mesorhizobium sp. L-8-3]|uniref:Bug family tripartite tricarboxylate transporter substrate binding protein n=1 Tax=Mesorhizobium sp. L-8-3 TaxID=2744522 RepID=UPI00237B7678|nr:tripartite tricarboxylate transporter substrate binding protein [Mesorhizobium sp. L-8-3]
MGSPNHIAVLQMIQNSGAEMTHVPYKDGGLSDLLGGALDFSLDVTATTISHIKAGTLRPLVVSTENRIDVLPDTPTFSEAGIGAPLYSWNGVFARSGTPQEIIDRLSASLQKITTSEEFHAKVADFVQVPRGGTPEDFATSLATETENWGRVIKAANLKIE